jgi:polyhydroxybutyrate depolymerase
LFILYFEATAQRNRYNPSQKELITPLQSGTFNASIKSGGLVRTFQIHIPQGYNANKKLPVVIMLHGFGGNAQNALEQGSWKEKADKEGFIALGLDGTLKKSGKKERFLSNQRSWNSGSNETQADRDNINDVGFINDMIDLLIAKNIADVDRIYLTGFSNGAAMTFRAGAALSDKIAAIAPASSKLFVKVNLLKRPLPLIYFYGSEDPLNPIDGGKVKKLGVVRNLPPISETLSTWKNLLSCPTDKKEMVVLDK